LWEYLWLHPIYPGREGRQGLNLRGELGCGQAILATLRPLAPGELPPRLNPYNA